MNNMPREPGAPYGLPAVSDGDRASTRNPGSLGPGGFKLLNRCNSSSDRCAVALVCNLDSSLTEGVKVAYSLSSGTSRAN